MLPSLRAVAFSIWLYLSWTLQMLGYRLVRLADKEKNTTEWLVDSADKPTEWLVDSADKPKRTRRYHSSLCLAIFIYVNSNPS